jgi:hypothetical protein
LEGHGGLIFNIQTPTSDQWSSGTLTDLIIKPFPKDRKQSIEPFVPPKQNGADTSGEGNPQEQKKNREAQIARLARITNSVDYERERNKLAAEWKVTRAAIDAEVIKERAKMRNPSSTEEPPPLVEKPEIATAPDILKLFLDDIGKIVVDEETNVQLIFLQVVSRLFKKPISAVVKGPSATGKSYVSECVLKFFPEGAYVCYTTMSERSLVYDTTPLQHRILVIFEAAGIGSDTMDHYLRTLLSEARIVHQTVDRDTTTGALVSRRLTREGPTGLLMTTTKSKLNKENESRILSLRSDDSPEHIQAVIDMVAAASEGKQIAIDFSPWHQLAIWLEQGEREVIIPFATIISSLTRPTAERLTRDFGQLMSLIRAHALLHRATRDQDAEGRIIATLDDYAAVRTLIEPQLADCLVATVPKTVRETVQKVIELTERVRPTGNDSGETYYVPTTVTELARALKINKSNASRRLAEAIDLDFVINLQTRKGYPMMLEPYEPMPDDSYVLPPPDAVKRKMTSV